MSSLDSLKTISCWIYNAKFLEVDGQRDSTREHIARFIDAMKPFSHDAELCLKEFSKSLIDRVYTWYLNLKQGSIQSWEHLVMVFNAKFY